MSLKQDGGPSSKKKTQLGFLGIAISGRLLEEFRQEPQEKCGIEVGGRRSLSAWRMLTTPRPWRLVWSRSSMFRARFAEEAFPPWPSMTRRLSWMAPMLALEMFP
jgi:hypothetical protein